MPLRTLIVAGLLWGLYVPSCFAQLAPIVIKPKQPVPETQKTPRERPAPRIPQPAANSSELASVDTILEIDILSPGLVGDPSAQQWGKLFEELGASVRIRNGRDLQAEVTEKTRGSLRYVHASGLLNRDGELSFGTESFHLDDNERLKEWLDELKTYGAQGAPSGKPLWGLSKSQFTSVYEQLSRPLATDVRGKTVTELASVLRDEQDLPVRLATETQSWLLEDGHDQPLSMTLDGFSLGTGLAIALNSAGVGMRPLRTPAGTIEYEVLPLEILKDPWPMGWEPEESTPRGELTPNLFKKGRVGFEDAPLVEVLETIAIESSTPIVIDRRRCLARKVDVEQKRVSYSPREIAWALVVSQVVRQSGLYNYYRQDETGLGFILVAPFEPKASKPD